MCVEGMEVGGQGEVRGKEEVCVGVIDNYLFVRLICTLLFAALMLELEPKYGQGNSDEVRREVR